MSRERRHLLRGDAARRSCSAPAPQLGRRPGRRRPRRRRSSASSRGATCCAPSASRAPRRAAPAGLDLSERAARASRARAGVRGRRRRVGEGFEGVYLVGGAVRDLLMDEPSFDVDIAVEGDGIAFGRALAKALGGRVVPHEKFGTAVVDRTTAAGSTWPRRAPSSTTTRARCPAVEQASIRQDLYRRDFTINALAVSLKGEDFGRLVDFFGGLRRPGRRRRSACSTTSRSSTTRRASSARSATRTATASGWTAHTPGSRGRASRWSSSASSRRRGCATSSRRCSPSRRSPATLRRLAELRLDRGDPPAPGRRGGGGAARRASWTGCARGSRRTRPRGGARLAVLARRLPPDELYDWFERLRLRRRDADSDRRRGHGRAAAARARRGHGRARRAARASSSRTIPTACCMAMAGRRTTTVRERLRAATSTSCAACGWRSRAATWPSSASPSRRRSAAILDEVLRRKLNGELRRPRRRARRGA